MTRDGETGARETGTDETGTGETGTGETGTGETGTRETGAGETGTAETGTRETGARNLVAALVQRGVGLAFGLPGVHNLPIWRALADSPIRLVGVRHEQAAVYAADGYARATGRLGVALVTTGPGAANALAATGEAMASSSPVLVIATDIPMALRRPGVYRGVLHETRDQAAMFAPVTRSASHVTSADEIAAAVHSAAATAERAPSGPVYLGVPTDLLSAPARAMAAPARGARVGIGTGRAAGPDGAALDAAVALIDAADHPLIWSGGGAIRAGAGGGVDALARTLAAPVITTYMGRGIVPPDHPCAVPGPVHLPPVGALWDEADLVLTIGSDLDGMMTQNWRMPAPPRLVAINVDPDDAAKNYPPDVVLAGDAHDVLDRLVPRLARRDGLAELSHRLRGLAAEVAAAVSADEPQAAQMLDVLERVLPADTVVVADMCIPGYWLAGFRSVPAPRKLAYPVGWGTLGFAFPASIGAALAASGPAVCVTGDGGFLFACGELATVVDAGVALTIVLVDDGGYGMLRFDQQSAGEEPFGVDLAGPDFARLSEAFGVPAVTVDGFGAEFAAALADAVGSDGARMVVVRARMKPPPTTSPRWYRGR